MAPHGRTSRAQSVEARSAIDDSSVANKNKQKGASAEMLPSLQARLACRAGMATTTAGVANGFVQGNLAILPEKLAPRFTASASSIRSRARSSACPMSAAPAFPRSALDLDIRTDLPRYRVWRDGEVVEEPTDIMAHWRDDLVAFVLGCSFSFEEALLATICRSATSSATCACRCTAPISPARPAGPFAGPMVVSMRPFKPADAIRAVQITSRFPSVHGAPVHLGHPHSIGIADIAKPDYGDPVPVEADEIPVFWACGVTPQAVIAAAKLPFAITHAPGLMLVTDLKNKQLAVL
jgi:uncharacterized protein YcsI (UPF0317 family)